MKSHRRGDRWSRTGLKTPKIPSLSTQTEASEGHEGVFQQVGPFSTLWQNMERVAGMIRYLKPEFLQKLPEPCVPDEA